MAANSKILIINLRRLGDVYSTAHLISSLHQSENCQIEILVYKESVKAAQNIKGIHKIHTIDRQEIATLKANKLFSDGFALELLYNQTKSITETRWTNIVNFSNDPIGAYLTSYFKEYSEKVTGVHFSEERNIITQNDWELIFNDVLSTMKYSPIHFVDCYHQMLATKYSKASEILNNNQAHNEAAFANINHIRKTYGEGSTTKIIAIQPLTADACKNIPFNTICDFISALNSTKEFIPLILIAPTQSERDYAEKINEAFENKLIIVEADLQAVASVLMNVDLLVTPDTVIKHIADLSDTPVIEVSLGYAPFLKQGTVNTENLVLTNKISDRNFSKAHFADNETPAENFTIRASDIYASVLYYFGTRTTAPHLSENVTLYTVGRDNLGVIYRPVAGDIDTRIEINRIMTRLAISALFDLEQDENSYVEVLKLSVKEARQWAEAEKANITQVMKDLLGTLRSLLQLQENKKHGKEFAYNLGRLLSNCESEYLTIIPTLIFRSKIESLGSGSLMKNIKEIESLLYELKGEIQKILGCIKLLEEAELQAKKEAFAQKRAFGAQQSN